uniref:Uncharacterized protein n=1 Tax=Setaria italica TaxID=4555 RepID=K4A3H7_SETIT
MDSFFRPLSVTFQTFWSSHPILTCAAAAPPPLPPCVAAAPPPLPPCVTAGTPTTPPTTPCN